MKELEDQVMSAAQQKAMRHREKEVKRKAKEDSRMHQSVKLGKSGKVVDTNDHNEALRQQMLEMDAERQAR